MIDSLSVTYHHTIQIVSSTRTHTQPFYGSGFCLGQAGWATIRRNIHPLTPIMVINHPLSASSI